MLAIKKTKPYSKTGGRSPRVCAKSLVLKMEVSSGTASTRISVSLAGLSSPAQHKKGEGLLSSISWCVPTGIPLRALLSVRRALRAAVFWLPPTCVGLSSFTRRQKLFESLQSKQTKRPPSYDDGLTMMVFTKCVPICTLREPFEGTYLFLFGF